MAFMAYFFHYETSAYCSWCSDFVVKLIANLLFKEQVTSVLHHQYLGNTREVLGV